MDKELLEDFTHFLDLVIGEGEDTNNLILYRGQSNSFPLLPTIARAKADVDTKRLEQDMLEQLKRRSRTVISKHLEDEWDWLVYAQHFGMKTRLLDWTSNPLVALWFAATEAIKSGRDAFVYALEVEKNMILNKKDSPTPWSITRTQVFKPDLNNERILAQAGWFTAHCFSVSTKKWVDLRFHKSLGNNVVELVMPNAMLKSCLRELNIMGVNHQSLFPDAEGVCKHINWLANNGKLSY